MQKFAEFEKKVAKILRARRHAFSGAKVERKGDFSSKVLIGECKMTEKRSLAIQKQWLQEVSALAYSKGKFPALAFKIGDEEWIAFKLRDWPFLEEVKFGR